MLPVLSLNIFLVFYDFILYYNMCRIVITEMKKDRWFGTLHFWPIHLQGPNEL